MNGGLQHGPTMDPGSIAKRAAGHGERWHSVCFPFVLIVGWGCRPLGQTAHNRLALWRFLHSISCLLISGIGVGHIWVT